MSFSGLDFSNVKITGADLEGSICHKTNFTNANLENVNFLKSYLCGAYFD